MTCRGWGGKKGRAFQMLTKCKNLPSDIKSISPGIIQRLTYLHVHTWMHTHTRPHSSAASQSNFLCTPSETASFTPNFQPSLSISPKIKLVCSQSVPACLAACTICCQPGEDGNAQQSAGTSQHCRDCQPLLRGNHTSFSQITEALDGPFPASSGNEKMKGGGTRWWKRETKRVKSLSERWPSPVMWPIPLAAYQNRGWVNGVC